MAFRRIFSKLPSNISATVSTTNRHHVRHLSENTGIWISQRCKNYDKKCIPNGAMKRGPQWFMDGYETNQGTYEWILMPGVPKENVSVEVMGNQVTFKGSEALPDPEFRALHTVIYNDELLRVYKWSVYVDPARYDAARVKAELVNGVLWVHIPNRLPN